MKKWKKFQAQVVKGYQYVSKNWDQISKDPQLSNMYPGSVNLIVPREIIEYSGKGILSDSIKDFHGLLFPHPIFPTLEFFCEEHVKRENLVKDEDWLVLKVYI
jgi:hypothetical protein